MWNLATAKDVSFFKCYLECNETVCNGATGALVVREQLHLVDPSFDLLANLLSLHPHVRVDDLLEAG